MKITQNFQKKKVNQWLLDEAFLEKTGFHDMFYLQNLCGVLAKYVEKCPVPVISTWDFKNDKIYFILGQTNKYGLKVDVNVSYYDFVTLVHNWLYRFFPAYECEYKAERPLTPEEIIKEIDAGNFSVDDALDVNKIVDVKEQGVIEKIYITKDEFKININGDLFLRLTTIPISEFLKTIRKIENPNEKRSYIFSYSTGVFKIPSDSTDEIIINYPDKMLYNFFKINVINLFEEPITLIKKNTYKWGRFKIEFKNESLKNECMAIVENFKKYRKVNNGTIEENPVQI